MGEEMMESYAEYMCEEECYDEEDFYDCMDDCMVGAGCYYECGEDNDCYGDCLVDAGVFEDHDEMMESYAEYMCEEECWHFDYEEDFDEEDFYDCMEGCM